MPPGLGHLIHMQRPPRSAVQHTAWRTCISLAVRLEMLRAPPLLQSRHPTDEVSIWRGAAPVTAAAHHVRYRGWREGGGGDRQLDFHPPHQQVEPRSIASVRMVCLSRSAPAAEMPELLHPRCACDFQA